MTFSFAIVSNFAITTLKFVNQVGAKIKKLPNLSLDWKTTFVLHCGKELLTDLYKRFLRFKENVPKYGRTTNNSLLGTVCTICLEAHNLSQNFLLHWSIILTV